jgi:hypothetical protein
MNSFQPFLNPAQKAEAAKPAMPPPVHVEHHRRRVADLPRWPELDALQPKHVKENI